MPDNEVGNQTLGENTKITVTIKTLLWAVTGLLTILVTVFGIIYFDNKKTIKDLRIEMAIKAKTEAEAAVKYVREDVSEIKTKVNTMSEQITIMDKSVGIILDRTSGMRTQGTSNTTIDNNTPGQ